MSSFINKHTTIIQNSNHNNYYFFTLSIKLERIRGRKHNEVVREFGSPYTPNFIPISQNKEYHWGPYDVREDFFPFGFVACHKNLLSTLPLEFYTI